MKLSNKILLSLLGIPFSALIILILYFLVYIILGEDAYIIEISKIQDVSILFREFVIISISMFIAIFSLLVSMDTINNKDYKISTKLLEIGLLVIGFAIFPICFVEIALASMEIIKITFLILWITLIAIISLVFMVKDFLNVWIINKKLKQN